MRPKKKKKGKKKERVHSSSMRGGERGPAVKALDCESQDRGFEPT